MNINNQDVVLLSSCLQQTLSPDVNVRKPAEKHIESLEGNPNYPLLLLTLIDSPTVDMTIRITASIAFKNYIKKNWVIEDESIPDKINQETRNTIKTSIISLMLKSPEQIQRQLSDSVSIIGKADFPDNWPNLINEMLNHISSSNGDLNIINGVLQTAHSLFKRYRHEFKSDKLWLEIKFVLDKFADPLTTVFVNSMELSISQANNKEVIVLIFKSLLLCSKIFLSLNSQDIPEFFEDNINIWMSHFLQLLNVNNPLLKNDSEDEPGLLEQLKSQICENIGMYAQKYHDIFQPFLERFVENVWHLLTQLSLEPKYDLLVSNAIQFISTVARRPQYQSLFKAEGVLSLLCEKVIVPNMQFRQSDEEMFEDNPEEYIRRDIEGSDVDTRRRAACDLVKSLTRYFENEITTAFSGYIKSMLDEFAANPVNSWKSKDAAIYLVTSLSVKASTARQGVTQTTSLVNIVDFYQNFIKPDLENPDLSYLPVIRADGLKYIVTFRNLLPINEAILPIFPVVIKHLASPSVVVHTYAANAIEKIFTLYDSNTNALVIKPALIQPFIEPLLKNLFNVLNMPESIENEYVMKAIMRTLSTINENMLPYLNDIFPKFVAKIHEVSKNPKKPHFNHYLFESLCLIIKVACSKDKSVVILFQNELFPLFQFILSNDCQEFMPYVFQIFSLMLEVFDKNEVPPAYMQLFPLLLSSVLWERPANIHPLVRLLQALIRVSSNAIVESGKINSLLGIFQKLLASKSNDHEGFYLLQSMIEHISIEHLKMYINGIFLLLFQRLHSSKTSKFVKNLIVFFSLFTVKNGSQLLIETINSIQNNLFSMVLEKIIIADVQKVTGKLERKICAVGMTKILCEDPNTFQKYKEHWFNLLKAVVAVFELPEDESVPQNEHFIEIEDTPGYQASYSQLRFGKKVEEDPFGNTIPDEKIYLARSLHDLSLRIPNLLQMIQANVEPQVFEFLKSYFLKANINI